ncbi:Methyl-accepting chemotaxis protein III [compost metagenome]
MHSVRRVSDLISEITAAAGEQRDGIHQVNQAVSNLDQMTQQNAALVEESSAAATAMSEQAQRLAEVVAVFKVDAMAARQAPAAVPVAAPAALRAAHVAPQRVAPTTALPAAKPQAVTPARVNGDDWESF